MFLRSRGQDWPAEIVEKAKELRLSGLSYGDISTRLGIAKSTLFSWISDIKRPGFITKADRDEHLRKIRVLAVAANKRKRDSELEKISRKITKEVENYSLFKSQNYRKSLLSMLYWAEGAKTGSSLKFVNTDPKLISLFLTLLRGSFPIDETKLRVRLHLHYYHPISKTRSYWSRLLTIPLSQFGKIYIKPRSKSKRFRKNFMGICFIIYHNRDTKFEVLERAYKIAKEIVPVA